MKKSEAIEQGRIAGAAQFAILHGTGQLVIAHDADFDAIRQRAGEQASAFMASRHMAMNTPFFDAFVNAFNLAARAAWAELPETKAAQLAAATVRLLDQWVTNWTDDDRPKFAERLESDPAYAFEWADAALRGAVRHRVALMLREIVEKAGPAEAIAVARREALRGAQYPSSSTSALSNLCALERTSALATFVADLAIFLPAGTDGAAPRGR